MATLSEVQQANDKWFSRGNKRLFGDINYRILHGKDGEPYLVRSTNYQWSDMFGRVKTICWRINLLSDELKILPLVSTQFKSLDDVKDWLRR